MTELQVKYVRNLLYREGISFMEKELAEHFSCHRTNVLEDLNHAETKAIIEHLAGKTAKDTMTGKILSMAHEMRWELPDGKIDMKRLNAWCVKYTAAHVPLNKIPTNQLSKVVSVFEKMYKTYLKSI
jgi:hypothetical protein